MLTGLSGAALAGLPQQLIQALASGNYQATGGVIMDAAGRVISHIVADSATGLPISVLSSVAGNIQIHKLSGEVQKVLSYSMASTALAGLGLAVSLSGFVYLSKKVGDLERRIEEVKDILLSEYMSRFRGAIDDYKLASNIDRDHLRQPILLRAQRSFGDFAHFFNARMRSSSKLPDIVAAEGYYVLAALGHAMCSSDLEMWEESEASLAEHYSNWQTLARQQTRELLGLDEPARLLHRQYVDELPTEILIQLLDFTHDEQRNTGWLDDMRRGLSDRTMLMAVGRVDPQSIRFARALRARNDVLAGYLGHFRYLADNRLSATGFSSAVSARLEQLTVAT
jgi:hypothetical protein